LTKDKSHREQDIDDLFDEVDGLEEELDQVTPLDAIQEYVVFQDLIRGTFF